MGLSLLNSLKNFPDLKFAVGEDKDSLCNNIALLI
jgi:hypothetical protein